MKRLIIAEKPSAAEKIAYALGTPSREKYGRVNYFRLRKDNEEIFVVPAVGHLLTLRARGKDLPIFDLEWVPTYEVNKNAFYTKQYLEAITSLSKNMNDFIIATDYDLEGDLIGGNIAKYLHILDRTKRMKFSTLVPSELREAYENLEELNMWSVSAAEARHKIDWIYGINLSRFIIEALGAFGKRKTLSIGRVQGPMLKFLVEREKEIASFVPQDFWEIYIIVRGIKFKHEEGQFFKEEEVKKVQRETLPTAEVSIERKKKIISPFPPFDFTTLQVEAYNLFGFTPIKTEEIAQSLYTNALISYPRTSSQKLPARLNLQSIIKNLEKVDKYKHLARKLLEEKRFKPREGKKEDVHPAIFPTGLQKKLSTEEQKIYDLIVRRFLACFAENAEIEERKIKLKAGKHIYSKDTTKIIKEGWLEFYPTNIKEEEIPLKEGEKVNVEKFEVTKGKTSPPKRFTPASIIRLLDELNIGTKTTRAIILDTLYKRDYIKGTAINVTPLGFAVFEIFQKYSPEVVDVDLTRKLEGEIEDITSKKRTQEEVLNETKKILSTIIKKMQTKKKEIGEDLLKKLSETERFAPCKCGGFLRIIQKNKNKFLGCTNYPKCKITYSLPSTRFSYAGQCTCGAPIIWYIKGKQRFKLCLNPNCPLKQKQKESKNKK